MIVLDASVVVEMLLNSVRGEEVRRALLRSNASLAAPHLLDVEVASAIRRLALSGDLPLEQLDEVFPRLYLLPLERYEHLPLLPRIWELRQNFTAYDATYIALAEQLGAVLYTSDSRLAHGHHAKFQIFG